MYGPCLSHLQYIYISYAFLQHIWLDYMFAIWAASSFCKKCIFFIYVHKCMVTDSENLM